MMSKYDPWVNMLRTTVAAFAAGVGGADAVTVLPFDSPLGAPDAFGRRIARNTSHLLIDESHVATVADPAGGAYAVEKLTDDLAVAAWELFGRLEEGAGPRRRDRGDRGGADREVATRKRPMTGLTEFPNLAETAARARPPAPGEPEVRRYGAAFEALRDDPAAEPVFLATMGTVAAAHRARDVRHEPARGRWHRRRVAGATEAADDLVAAYDGQPVVCLAGSDVRLRRWADEAAAALREAGRAVGRSSPASRASGADDSCADGRRRRSTS